MLDAGDWKPVPGSFMILLKWKYSEIWPFFNSWHLQFLIVPYSSFQKCETLESWHKCLLSNWSRLLNWKRTWNLAPILQIIQKIPENYCPCLYLTIGQVWWLTELWFKRYIQKCMLSHVVILIISWHHRFRKLWDD